MKKKAAWALLTSLAGLIAAASAPGVESLALLTWKGYAPQALLEKFESETGIRVKPTFSSTEEMIARLRAGQGAGFDLVEPSQDRIAPAQEQFKIFQPIDYGKIDTEKIIPSLLVAVQKNTRVGGASYAVPHVFGTYGLIVNRRLAPDANDYGDLFKEPYAGRISYRLTRRTLIAAALAMGQDPYLLARNPKGYETLMQRVGEKLIGGKNLLHGYWNDGEALLESLRRSEVHLALAWDSGGWRLHGENPDIDYLAPKSGALGWIDAFAIPARSGNVGGAYRWINFMLRPENAAVLVNLEKVGTAALGAVALADEGMRDNFQRSFGAAGVGRIRWDGPLSSEVEAIEGRILEKVAAAR